MWHCLDILPTTEEIYVPDSMEIRPKEINTLFKDLKGIWYRFSKQWEINWLLKEFNDRAISDFNVNIAQQQLKLKQWKDASFKDIIQYLSCDNLPLDKSSARNVMNRAKEYALDEDILFCVPTQQKEGKVKESNCVSLIL